MNLQDLLHKGNLVRVTNGTADEILELVTVEEAQVTYTNLGKNNTTTVSIQDFYQKLSNSDAFKIRSDW